MNAADAQSDAWTPRSYAASCCLIGTALPSLIQPTSNLRSGVETARATSANTTTVAATPGDYVGLMSYFSPSYPGPKCPLCRQCQWAVPGRCIYGGPYQARRNRLLTVTEFNDALRQALDRARAKYPHRSTPKVATPDMEIIRDALLRCARARYVTERPTKL